MFNLNNCFNGSPMIQMWGVFIAGFQVDIGRVQGGRTWQPFVGGKNGHENFRQTRIYNFCDKCVVFARNRKFANLTE